MDKHLTAKPWTLALAALSPVAGVATLLLVFGAGSLPA